MAGRVAELQAAIAAQGTAIDVLVATITQEMTEISTKLDYLRANAVGGAEAQAMIDSLSASTDRINQAVADVASFVTPGTDGEPVEDAPPADGEAPPEGEGEVTDNSGG